MFFRADTNYVHTAGDDDILDLTNFLKPRSEICTMNSLFKRIILGNSEDTQQAHFIAIVTMGALAGILFVFYFVTLISASLIRRGILQGYVRDREYSSCRGNIFNFDF